MTARILLVGWDGADRALVEEWVSAGRLPNLARLRARGRRGEVASLPGLGDDAAWATFSTTVGPERHGRFWWGRLGADGVDFVAHRRDEFSDAPFWDALVAAGKRVAVVDVPKSPMGDDRALVVADWMTHGREQDILRLSPAAAAHPLAPRFGAAADTDFDCNAFGDGIDDVSRFARECEQRTEARTDLLCELLAADDWDLFATVIAAPHCAGHRAWRDHDPGHPEHDPQRRATVGDVVERSYIAADRALGRLVAAAGDAAVLCFSPLGMGPEHDGGHLVEEVFRRRVGAAPARPSGALDRVRHLVPKSLRARAPRSVVDAGRAVRLRSEASKPYRVLPVDVSTTALRIAAADDHVDARGARHVPTAARDEVETVLRSLTDPESGRPLVDAVVFTQDFYPGAVTFADAFVVWDATAPIGAVRIGRAPTDEVVRRDPPPRRSGNHRAGGWYVAVGPGVAPGAASGPARIVDLGPTVAAWLGVSLAGSDGRPIAGLTGGVDQGGVDQDGPATTST
ncbi:MAG: alkaline phosphatase family protein [Acidimicrobiia bacterium]